jgi:tetratricopeptide (TPR) repeat protein
MRKPGIIHLTTIILSVLIFTDVSWAVNEDISGLIDSGDYESAYRKLLDELDLKPDDESILYLLGVTAPSGSRSSLFLKEYLQKHADGSNSERIRRQLLDYYAAAGLNITAGRLFSGISAGDLDNTQDIYRIAIIKQRLGLYDEAGGLFRSALARSGDELAAWCQLGLADCDLLAERYGSAAERYADLIDRYPDSPTFPYSLVGLSETYRRMGDIDKSSVYYQLYRERFELAPGFEEIEAALMDDDSSISDGDLQSILGIEYYIQVGVFAKKNNAKRCVKQFRNSGYRSRMEKFEQNGRSFYRALIGPYGDEKSARREKDKLEKKQGEEYQVIIQ